MLSVDARLGRAHNRGYPRVDADNLREYESTNCIGLIGCCGVSIIGALALGVASALLMHRLATKVIIPGAIACSMAGLALGCIPFVIANQKLEAFR